jgi:hypothetical protein
MVIEKFTSHVILCYSANFEVNTKKEVESFCCTYVYHVVKCEKIYEGFGIKNFIKNLCLDPDSAIACIRIRTQQIFWIQIWIQ